MGKSATSPLCPHDWHAPMKFCSFVFPLLPHPLYLTLSLYMYYHWTPLFAQYLYFGVNVIKCWTTSSPFCITFIPADRFNSNLWTTVISAPFQVYHIFDIGEPWSTAQSTVLHTLNCAYHGISTQFSGYVLTLVHRIKWCTQNVYPVYHGRRGTFSR